MATAALNPQTRNYDSPHIRKTAYGWTGSKAGKRNDIITIGASGDIDQAVAVSTEVATGTLIGILKQKVASSVAAASTTAKAVKYQIPTDGTILEMKVVTDSDTEVTVTAAMVGDKFSIWRTANGFYCANTADTLHLVCVGINTARNTGYFTVQQSKRLTT